MAIVYEITALYRRTVQPKDYESSTAEVGLKAQLEEGDNVDGAAGELLGRCRGLCLQAVTGKALGKSEAEVTVGKAGRGISDKPEDRGEADEGLPGDSSEEELTPAQKSARTRAANKAKKDAEAAKAAADAAEDADGLPGDEDGLPGDEDGDEYDISQLNDDEDEIVTASDLQAYITGAVQDRLLPISKAKEIMVTFGDGAGRVKDIPEESRNDVYEKIQEAVAENKKAAKK